MFAVNDTVPGGNLAPTMASHQQFQMFFAPTVVPTVPATNGGLNHQDHAPALPQMPGSTTGFNPFHAPESTTVNDMNMGTIAPLLPAALAADPAKLTTTTTTTFAPTPAVEKPTPPMPPQQAMGANAQMPMTAAAAAPRPSGMRDGRGQRIHTTVATANGSAVDAADLPEELVRERNVYVGALPVGFESTHFYELMSQFGAIASHRLFSSTRRVRETGRAYGFCLYEHKDTAARAVAALDGLVVDGRPIEVRLSSNGIVMAPPARASAPQRQQQQKQQLPQQTAMPPAAVHQQLPPNTQMPVTLQPVPATTGAPQVVHVVQQLPPSFPTVTAAAPPQQPAAPPPPQADSVFGLAPPTASSKLWHFAPSAFGTSFPDGGDHPQRFA